MNLKGFFLIVYAIISIGLFTLLDFYPLIYSSFLLNSLILTLIIIYHLYYEKNNSPFLSSFIVFNFLFFIVAPIVQISSFSDLSTAKYVNFFHLMKKLLFLATY